MTPERIETLFMGRETLVKRIAELETERDQLKERNETLEAKMERAMISVAHFTQRYNDDLGIMMSLKHEQMRVEAERDQFSNQAQAEGWRADAMQAENARLRLALADAPHTEGCRWLSHPCLRIFENNYASYTDDGDDPCDCWKAALACTPEAKS